MFSLHYATPKEWVDTVLADFDAFLIDHAAAEKKASGMAISMLSHYPNRSALVKAMADLAIEELAHFREVIKIMSLRGLQLGADTKDPYVNQLRKLTRKGSEAYMLDRLILGAVIEARGCERFGLVATALPEGDLKNFYQLIADSEAKHGSLFIDLAELYFPKHEVAQRLEQVLQEEAKIVQALPIVAALH